MSRQRIQLGEVIVHSDAKRAVEQGNQTVQEFLDQFADADFGSIDAETHEFNRQALQHGGDVLGIYTTCSKSTIWVISDTKTTEVVLP